MRKKIDWIFGPFSVSLEKQATKKGLLIGSEDLEKMQMCADGAVYLHLHNFLTDREYQYCINRIERRLNLLAKKGEKYSG